MRTTQATLDFTLAGKPASARSTGVTGVIFMVWRSLRNRRATMRLHDLNDKQLDDIGLSRHDVRSALASPFFDSPCSHLTRAAQERANGYYRGARRG